MLLTTQHTYYYAYCYREVYLLKKKMLIQYRNYTTITIYGGE